MSRGPTILLPARRQQVKECAWSRLGLAVGKQIRQSLIRRVWKGDVKYARKLTNSRTVIVLDYDGRRDGVSLLQRAEGDHQLPASRCAGNGGVAARPIDGNAGPARRRREGVRW